MVETDRSNSESSQAGAKVSLGNICEIGIAGMGTHEMQIRLRTCLDARTYVRRTPN